MLPAPWWGIDRRSILVVVLVVWTAAVAGTASSAGPQSARWSITELGTFPEHPVIAVAINDAGEAIGQNDVGPLAHEDQQEFVWRGGRLSRLGYAGSRWVGVAAINNRGDIAGNALLADGRQPSILWRGSEPVVLGTLGGKWSYPSAMNDSDEVVGVSKTANGQEHGFLWRDGRMIDLGTLGGRYSSPIAINNRGQVIGDSTTASGGHYGFLWQSGRMTKLASLPGLFSHADAINNSGEIVGMIDNRYGSPFAAAAWKNGKLKDLGRFDADAAEAIAINDSGHILVRLMNNGINANGGTWSRAVLLQDGQQTRLGSFEGDGLRAIALNARDQIAGNTLTSSRAFIWQNGHITLLPSLGMPTALNNHGEVLGWNGVTTGGRYRSHVVLWRPITSSKG